MVRKVIAVGLVLMLAGCLGTVAVQTVHTVVGPMGQFQVIRQYASKSELAKYRAIEVVKFKNTMPVAIPDTVVAAVQTGIVAELRDYKGVTLERVQVTAVDSYYRSVTLTPTMVMTGTLLDITSDEIPAEKLIGGANHLIARIQLLDKGTGAVLLEANLRGYVKSAIDFKQESLGKGMGRGAADLVEKILGWKRKGMLE
ncbi:MAG: hypothetical protein AMS16_04830 [Planctomycetes bacterium DG_58]|nr:MAG: hypothetical protein AMS16_04830 [Planctomycetes bacterium DG_58]KPK99326.1 MAG: hypothetical protein AMK75_06700 [Planctomycetes bacterium SM23_65]